LALVIASCLAYVVIFSFPLAQKKFFLDPSNLVVTSMALGIGVQPRLWREPAASALAPAS